MFWIWNSVFGRNIVLQWLKICIWILNPGDGLAEQPEGASEAVGEEVELGEVGQRGIHCPGKIAQLKAIKNITW